MNLVIIESPFAAKTFSERIANLNYAREAMKDSLSRGEVPFAGHLLYPQVLNDDDPAERQQGIACHFAWLRKADRVAFYLDRGMSKGMKQADSLAYNLNITIEYRYLDKTDKKP